MTHNSSQIENLLTKWVARIIDGDHLRDALASGKKLKIKLGIDPSGTIIHLGHMVPILKLKQFQELGHEIIIIIGDATGMVGDASDKDSERPMLLREQTRANGKVFIEKFARVLDLEKTKIVYNSDWLDKVNFAWVGELAKNFSVAEMLDRDNFSKRYKAWVRISLQEFLYPLMQGYDSVALDCDVELGGTEQYFNLLAGRRLQEAYGQRKQDLMMFDLLVGSDGKKMSKTSPNTVAIDEAPQSMYQKLINISDDLIVKYFELATDATMDEVATVAKRLEWGEHPNILKKELAQRIVTMYHGREYDPEDKWNIENYDLWFIIPVNILIENSVISKEDIAKMNEPISLDSFVKIVWNLSWIDDEEELKMIRDRLNSINWIRTDDAIIELLKALWESPSWSSKAKGSWINRAKEIWLNIKTSLEAIILLKEFVEFVVLMSWFEIDDEDPYAKYKFCSISDLLKILWFCNTSGDVRNALAGNSVRVNGEIITDAKFLVNISSEGTLIEMGKKKAKRVFL
jgi:tyrosyl-tRNA synthetase